MTETLEPRRGQEPSEPASPPADLEDIRAACDGDGEAFDRLVRRHQEAVLRAARYLVDDREDALEVAQETFLKAYRGLSGFRGEASIRTWLLRIATNCARSLQAQRLALKRSGPGPTLSLSRGGETDAGRDIEVPCLDGEPGRRLETLELQEALEAAIHALPAEFREVVVLRDLGGRTYEEIAQSLDLPVGTVKSKVHRARVRLREAIRPYL